MGLVFNTLPMIFNQMYGGYFFCLMFFILLAIAALTSTVSLLEVMVAFATEELHTSRNKATVWSSVAAFAIGAFATLSLRTDTSLAVGGMSFFDMLDWFTANILLPVGGFFIVIFVGWFLGKKVFVEEITNSHTIASKGKLLIFFLIRYVAPVAIAVIFISRLV